MSPLPPLLFFFFFNDTAPPEIYTLSLHDALPIWVRRVASRSASDQGRRDARKGCGAFRVFRRDRKSTRLNSSHRTISYAVFCLKKKKKNQLHDSCTIVIHIF